MERKRKLPARAARADSVSKKRILTPPELQTPRQISESQSILCNERTPLPTSITPGKPLPTIAQPQLTDLSLKDYQSIPERQEKPGWSLLSESLHRSRQKWTSEGIFEKYWTKSRRGKNTPKEPPGNPPKDSMVKLGTCTIIVEPHIFEATLYTVKDSTPRNIAPGVVKMPRPVLQYGPPGGISQQESTLHEPLEKNSLDIKSNSVLKYQETHAMSVNDVPTSLKSNQDSIKCDKNSENKTVQPAMESNPVSKSADPVIQMLAQRAATDADLQYLMGKVANGQATTEQLLKFKRYINEVTTIQQERQEQDRLKTNKLKSSPACINFSMTAPPRTQVQSSTSPTHPSTTTEITQNQTNPPAPSSKESPSPSKSDVTGVVLEFSNGNGDRYSFPKFSILEFIPCSNQVIVSFLIIRKGSDAESPSYNPKLDYYQPMTIRLYAHQTRQLDALRKAVESTENVRAWMNRVMEECQRAEYVLLAMRLPREFSHSTHIDSEDKLDKKNQLNEQVNWITTHIPQIKTRVKSAKRIETEDTHYEKYIKSIEAIS
ncbi:hypothetical protein OnM2_082024 [Erysiphe neolycopersici]|uniref:SWR1-complex protein 3 domain-containing protein n=1 Tax=Erysiphe neolycopersici TaxID=212602 RepID=A0A420HFN7_9PEZI|nr:hypothetical protein OnM2_082024 [Erysiphe neolycopersici]